MPSNPNNSQFLVFLAQALPLLTSSLPVHTPQQGTIRLGVGTEGWKTRKRSRDYSLEPLPLLPAPGMSAGLNSALVVSASKG